MVQDRERMALERAIRAVAEQVQAAGGIVDEALAAGSDTVALSAKMLRLELLHVKADLERELSRLVLDCADCGRTVHWVSGIGAQPGHWAHREPAPHDAPACNYRPRTERSGARRGPGDCPSDYMFEARSQHA